jgi:hypothetical protein
MTKSKNGCLKILVCAGAGSDPSGGSDPETDAHADEVGAPARRAAQCGVSSAAQSVCSSKAACFFFAGWFELVRFAFGRQISLQRAGRGWLDLSLVRGQDS